MTWQLWRQDDNGVRYLVGMYSTRDDAEQKMADLTRNHHKQTYWIVDRLRELTQNRRPV